LGLLRTKQEVSFGLFKENLMKIVTISEEKGVNARKQKAEGRKQKAEGRKQKGRSKPYFYLILTTKQP
jgi:hypothetical protein